MARPVIEVRPPGYRGSEKLTMVKKSMVLPIGESMNHKYALHEDYRKVPVFNFRFNPLLMSFANGTLMLERFFNCRKPTTGTTRETRQVTSFDGKAVPAIIIRPDNLVKPAPLLLYYHGGAFALGYASGHVQMCERYALEAGCMVVMIDYRLAPRYPFPYGFNDCYATLEWSIANAASLGIDTSRIVVMGDSAGGAMAAGVAQKAFDKNITLRAQVLIYPVLDSDCKTPSATDFTDVPLWNANSNRRMWEMYLRDTQGKAPEYAAPGHRKNLAQLVPAYVETAEFDPLRDEGNTYALALQEQGVPVKHIPTRGTIHGFEMAGNNAEVVKAMSERISYLKQSFGS
jgi:acetyl esterase/lipase